MLFFKIATYGSVQNPAQLNITIINFPSLSIERYSFFRQEKEITVERIGVNTFSVKYFGNTPKLYYINFREVLISPGDNVNIVYECLNRDWNNYKDVIRAVGTNTDHYTYSNFSKTITYLPANLYPNIYLAKYQENISLFYNTLNDIYKTWSAKNLDSLNKYKINNELKDYLKRREKLNILSNLRATAKFCKEVKQKKILSNIIDSLFLNMNFKESDTAYAYYSEFSMKNYFSYILANKFNEIATEKDFISLKNYIQEYPNDFVKKYFVYFLATDNRNLITKYNSKDLDIMIKENPYIGRQRYIYDNKENIFWLKTN